MADVKSENRYEKLRHGEKVTCSKCGKGYYVPFNTSPDKAHTFNCSNKDCDNSIVYEPVIEID